MGERSVLGVAFAAVVRRQQHVPAVERAVLVVDVADLVAVGGAVVDHVDVEFALVVLVEQRVEAGGQVFGVLVVAGHDHVHRRQPRGVGEALLRAEVLALGEEDLKHEVQRHQHDVDGDGGAKHAVEEAQGDLCHAAPFSRASMIDSAAPITDLVSAGLGSWLEPVPSSRRTIESANRLSPCGLRAATAVVRSELARITIRSWETCPAVELTGHSQVSACQIPPPVAW